MAISFSGGCACGAIRYECSAEPAMSFNCHCRDCQRVSGGAYYPLVVVPAVAITFTKGSPKYNTICADSGNIKHYGFCSECGSPVDASIDEHSDIWVIAAGSFDDPSQFKPTMDIFTASAQSWVHMDPALEKFETAPSE